MAYRTAVHETTGCTPAQLMMGRDLRLPIDLLIGRPEDEVPQHASTYAEELQERLERVHNYARTHMKFRSDSMKERYDSASNCEQLNIGDPVWLHCPQRKKGVSPKLTRQWQGPYLVTKRINDMVYRVQLRPQTKPKLSTETGSGSTLDLLLLPGCWRPERKLLTIHKESKALRILNCQHCEEASVSAASLTGLATDPSSGRALWKRGSGVMESKNCV